MVLQKQREKNNNCECAKFAEATSKQLRLRLPMKLFRKEELLFIYKQVCSISV